MAVWAEEEKQFVKKNYKHMTYEKIASHLNRSEKSVRTFCHRNNLRKNTHNGTAKKWEPWEDQLLRKSKHITYAKLASLLRRTEGSVKRRALIISEATKLQRHEVNHDCFSSVFPESCYWAGFIAADGYITKGRTRLEISLSSKDKEHLALLRGFLGFTGPLEVGTRIASESSLAITKTINYARIRVSSARVVEDLEALYNITNAKSLTLQPPNLDSPMNIKSYIIGYLDGDGFINYKELKKEWGLGFTGTQELLCWIQKNLDSLYTTNKRKINILPVHTGKTFTYTIQGERAKTILTNLETVKVPKLQRKWGKFNQIIGGSA